MLTSTSLAPLAVCVLGAGWLGLPLAQYLAGRGHCVHVTTTTAEKLPALVVAGLTAVHLRLAPDQPASPIVAALGAADTLVVTLPPGARNRAQAAGSAAGPDYGPHFGRLRALAAALPATAVRRVLLLSSTAVYPDQPGAPLLTEAHADAAHPLVLAEQLLAPTPGTLWQTTVVRLAGLYGPGRHPGHFFGTARAVPQPEAPVNMLHLTDAVGALTAVLEGGFWGETLTAVAAGHPTRRAFYTAAARALGAAAPAFQPAQPVQGKCLSSARLSQLTGYAFAFDDPIAGLGVG